MSLTQQIPQDNQRMAERPAQPALQPTRDPGATLPDLIEVLLNKGVHLNLDLIISVADIPLIGVNLRATIAGIETMLEYGMMRQWDEQTRAWVQKSLHRHLTLAQDEEVLAAMAASHFLDDDFHRHWRPGRAYLTTHRLILQRREPAETLWQAPLRTIAGVERVRQIAIGGEERTRLRIRLKDGSHELISAADTEHLVKLLSAQLKQPALDTPAPEPAEPQMVGTMWSLERLSNSSTWRAGRAVLTDQGEFTWQSPLDSRASVRLKAHELESITEAEHSNPTDHTQVLRLTTSNATLILASPQLHQWQRWLHEWSTASKEAAHGTSRR
ncbi:gas vesicle protein [Nesterenkonia rhizosphaerae]|uniref:Gas vesicle protein n=1 Tax=Nesterenkonia rhizosphaerae TaxID=1348272 RepID=A0ABP9FT65_9MICC